MSLERCPSPPAFLKCAVSRKLQDVFMKNLKMSYKRHLIMSAVSLRCWKHVRQLKRKSEEGGHELAPQ